MLIISRVCAEFHDVKGEPIFAVTPTLRNVITEAPESIRQDPLFDMLLNDGSLEAVNSLAQKQRLENDPTAGHDATGKAVQVEKPAAEKTAGKSAGKAAAADSAAEDSSSKTEKK